MNFNLNKIFYILLAFSAILYFLPPKITWGIYTPNFLGWFWLLFLIPLTFITFIWLLISDLKKKRKQKLIIRSLIFMMVLVVSVGYWFYLFYSR